MNLLAIDTSTAASAVCVLRSDGSAFEHPPDAETLLARPAHARELMPAIHDQMRASGLAWHELESIAVGTGPGAYTGLRIGIATARAIAQARALDVRPVSSLRALAEGARAPLTLAVLDARRGQLFAALYAADEERWPPFLTRPDALVERLRKAPFEPVAAALAVGDGSLRFRDALEAAGVDVPPSGSRMHVVRALHVGRLAADGPALAPEAVLPDYLRVPDAQPSR